MSERETEQASEQAERDSGDGHGNGQAQAEQTEFQKRALASAKEGRKKRKEQEEKGPGFSLKRLHWAEFVGFAGALILFGSLFMKWFATDCITRAAAQEGGCNKNSSYGALKFGEFDAFQTFKYLDWILLVSCITPFILAYIIARGHKLSWKPGEVTMIIGMIIFALILLNGVILGKPGDTVDMHFELGYLVGLIGAGMIMVGGTLRQALADTERKPPGVM